MSESAILRRPRMWPETIECNPGSSSVRVQFSLEVPVPGSLPDYESLGSLSIEVDAPDNFTAAPHQIAECVKRAYGKAVRPLDTWRNIAKDRA